jgi:DNA-binding MarR family transcriptional regulator
MATDRAGGGGRVEADLFARACMAYGVAMGVVDPIRLRFWDSRGLTMSQLRLLVLIDRGPQRPIGELADEMNVKPATLSGLAERLERLRFIRREHDPADRRVVRVSLTADGKQVLGEIQIAARAYLEAVFERMGPAAVADFTTALEAFQVAAAAVQSSAEYAPD